MKHNPEIKADPLSRESLMVWLMLQPAEKAYSYCAPATCMLGQWVRSIDDNARPDPTGEFTYRVNGEIVNLSHFQKIAAGVKGSDGWTFGAALKRAMK